jgi:hypothetical protein
MNEDRTDDDRLGQKWSEGDDEWSEASGDEAGGFWHAGRRNLIAVEREVLRRRALWIRARAVAAAAAFWPVLFGALLAGVFMEEAQGVQQIVATLLMLLLFLGSVILFIGSCAIWRAAGPLLCDARRGSVERYTIVTLQLGETEALVQEAFQLGLLRRNSAEPQTMEKLPVSHWIWRVNDVRPAPWRRMFPPGQ